MWRSFRNSPIKKYFFWALSFKIICGILLGLLFTQYYQHGDTTQYYDSAQLIAQQSWIEFWESITSGTIPSQPVRAIYFTRIIAILIKLTQADYWLLTTYFSILSFMGSFFLANQLTFWKSKLRLPAVLAFLFFPSIAFWSSGLLKESVAFGCLAYLVGVYIRFKRSASPKPLSVIVGTCALFFLVILKYYVAAPLIPLLLYLVIYHASEKYLKWKASLFQKSALIGLILLLPSYLFFSWISYNLNFDRFWMIIQESHDLFIQVSDDQVIIPIQGFGLTIDVLLNFPYYLFSALYRPFIGEFWNFPIILSSVENFILLIMTVYALVKLNFKKLVLTPELIACSMYVLTLCLFLGYSTPNFGTLARYKVYYLPFFILLLEAPVNSMNKYLKK